MGNVRSRSETGKLYLDFQYQNQRCREQTALPNTPANRKKLETMLQKIEAEILLGQFDYGKYFPNSRMLPKLQKQAAIIAGHFREAPLFRDFSETWFQEMKSTWRNSYQSTVRGILDRQLLDRFGDKAVNEIKKADLLQFRADLGAIKKKNGQGLSATHINRHMKIMRMILNEAADRFEFQTPYRGIKPLKIPKSDIDPFTLDEINLFLEHIRPDFKDYYTVRFFTGMRTGEIDGLKWCYVDFERRQILIRETIVKRKIEYTKTDSSQREIHMSQPVYEALLRQKEATGDKEYVFCTRAGTPLDYNRVSRRVWYPILDLLGLRRRNAYQTRHTAATLWLASGETPEWIARQMGHSNTEMLFRVYSRYVPNLTRQDGSAFERLLASQLNSDESDELEGA